MDDPQFDARTKGLPHAAGSVRLSEIGAKGWRLLAEDLPLPVAVLRDSAIDANSRWMQAFAAQASLAVGLALLVLPGLFLFVCYLVMLPVVLAVGIALLVQGWRRGAAAWADV